MMADLFGDVLPALVGSHKLVGLAEQWVEVLGTGSVIRGRVSRDDKRRDVHHSIELIAHVTGRVEQVAVLELLAQPLQYADRLVEYDRQRDLGEILADGLAQDVPHAHLRCVRVDGGQLSPPAQNLLRLQLFYFIE